MEIDDGEAFYDAQVAPVLAELGKQLEARGMGFVAMVEFATGEYGTTATLPTTKGDALALAYIAARSRGNVDALAISWARYLGSRPHGSIVLQQMGIDPDPAKRAA